MKKLVFFCLFAVALCFCCCKKNQSGNSEAAVEDDTIGVSSYDCCDFCAGAVLTSPRVPNSYCDSCKCAPMSRQYVHRLDDVTEHAQGTSSDDYGVGEESEEELAKATAAWKAAMYDTVLSELRLAFNDDGRDDTSAAIYAVYEIIKKELDMIEKNWELNVDDLDEIAFTIKYKDDNYLTSMINGLLFHKGWAHPNLLIYTITIDIKNKKRLTLNDIVKIDNRFVKLVYNGLTEYYRDYDLGDRNDFYTMETLKDALLKTDVWNEGEGFKYSPDFKSYFDTEKMFIIISVSNVLGRAWLIDLPLDKIRTMIKLPNFPAGSQ